MAVQYIVNQSTSSTGPWTSVAGSPFSTLTDTVSGLTAGQTYYFQIISEDTTLGIMGTPTVAGPFTTTGGLTESPQGTKLTSTTGTIVDSSLGVWSLVNVTGEVGSLASSGVTSTSVTLTWTAPQTTGQSGLQVQHPNGTVDGTNVVELLYWNHQVYRDDANGWAVWNGSSWTAVSGDPSQSGGAESAQGTTITPSNYTTTTITDGSGNVWKLVATNSVPGVTAVVETSETSGSITISWTASQAVSSILQVAKNGVVDNSTNNVILLLYWNHQVYREEATGNWWYWNGSAWVVTSDPRGSQVTESPQGTTVTTSTGVIVDALLNSWTLVSNVGKTFNMVAENGTAVASTMDVTLILYWNHTVYYEASISNTLSNPGWWSWNGTVFVAVNGDPRGTSVTWNPSDKNANIVLSNNNLTAQSSGATSQSVRSSVGYTSGLYYFEITIGNITSPFAIGIATGTYNLSDSTGLGVNGSVGFYPDFPPQAIYTGPQSVESFEGYVVGRPVNTIFASQTLGSPSSGPFDTWTITATGGQIIHNGVVDTSSGSIIELYYHNHYVYQAANAANELGLNPGWWQWTGAGTGNGFGWTAVVPPTVNISDVNTDIISCAVNITAQLIWFSSPKMRSMGFTWNNSTTASPATGVGGYYFAGIGAGPYFVVFNDIFGGANATVNFGASTFNQTLPSGYVAWSSSGSQTTQSESTEGTTVTSTSQTIYASKTPGSAGSGTFDTWTISAAPGTNSSVVHNGVTDTTTSSLIELYYHNHYVYQESSNPSGISTPGWWYWSGTAWIAAASPSAQTESPEGTIVSSPTQQILASQTIGSASTGPFDTWTITAVGGQVVHNGVPDPTTASIIELFYHNHDVYQEASNGNNLGLTPGWWYWNGSTWIDSEAP